MTPPVSVRREQAGDAAAIHEVLVAAFPTDVEARLVDSLRDNGRLVVSLVAVLGTAVVGHVAFSPVHVFGAPRATGLGLAPIAVLPEFQRRGIGARLMDAGVDECARVDAGFVVVLGEPAYYQHFGFERADRRGLGNEYGATDAFMVLELVPDALDGVRGIVRYGDEFAAAAES